MNNKEADQPAQPHSMIHTFVVHSLDSITTPLAANKFSIFKLAYVAEQTGLSHIIRRGYKTFFMLISIEHKISKAYKN